MVEYGQDASCDEEYSTCKNCDRVEGRINKNSARLKCENAPELSSKMCSCKTSTNSSLSIPSFRIVFVLTVLTLVHVTSGFNLDIASNVEFNGRNYADKGSYFGYSVAMINTGDPNKWLLFGAPKANSAFLPNSEHPGAVYKCTIQPNGAGHACGEVKIDNVEGRDTASFDGQTKSFEHGHNNSWLGGSLDVNDKKGIVTCASRWYNTLYSEDHYYMNGLCYILPLNFKFENILKIPALVDITKQTLKYGNSSQWNYGMGSLGASVHYTSQGTDILLGAPGLRTWTGGFADVRGSNAHITQYNYPATEISELAGYAVTSGNYFGNGHTYFAIGAPRDKLAGKVYLYRSDQSEFIFENADITLDGSERNGLATIPMNGYFGATLCSVDVNKDGRDDLLVGAPFYSLGSDKQDEGLVLVYLGQEDSSFKIMTQSLIGSDASGARFGSSIASLGDINKDTYNDIVIGAPYEDDGLQGAIYIYNGCKTGVWPHYSLRIPASSVSKGLQSFGISLSRPVDMNDDGVNDIVVGAYLSDKAYLMFGQPVINVDISIKASVAQIDKDTNLKCVSSISMANFPCFEVDVCFSYTNRLYSSIDLMVTTTLDVYMGEYYRTAWQTNEDNILKTDLTIFSGDKICTGNKKVVIKTTSDLVTPVLIKADYIVKNIPSASYVKPTINKFNGENPGDKILVASVLLDFKKDCPNNDCQTDLHLSANAVHEQTNGYFVLGTPSLAIDIAISKTGHPSYSSTLFVAFPKFLQFQKIQKEYGDPEINCGFVEGDAKKVNSESEPTDSLSYQQSQQIPETSEDEHMLICSFGNPLYNDTGVRFSLIMHVPESVTETSLLFRLNATTLSTEMAPSDNVKDISVAVRNKVTTTFTGVSRPSYITARNPGDEYVLSHVLELRNQGPSPLPGAKLTIQYPQVQTGGKPILYLNTTTWSCVDPCKVTCSFPDSVHTSPIVHSNEAGPTYYVNESPSTGAAQELTDMKQHDCMKGECSRYECRLTNIPPRESAVVSMEFVARGTILDVVSDGHAVRIRSDAFIRLEEQERLITDVKDHNTNVGTDILPVSQPPQPVPWWVYLVSILGGILLIVILVLILWKIGFFKRQKKEELEQMQHKGEVEKMLPEDDAEKK